MAAFDKLYKKALQATEGQPRKKKETKPRGAVPYSQWRFRPEEMKKDAEWRKAILDLMKRWIEKDNVGPWEMHRSLLINRLANLETFIHTFFPMAGPAPFDPQDAAGLILLPKYDALKLARKLFGGGPGIARDLQAEDLTWNMNYYVPSEFER